MPGLKAKILVVDDSISMRMIVVSFLKKMGFTNIQEAEDGEIAMLMLREGQLSDEPFELVVSDWFMPNVTGLEFLKAVREDSLLSQTPFLMVTAEGEEKHVQLAVEAGVTDMIIKPFSIEQVHEKVKKILGLN